MNKIFKKEYFTKQNIMLFLKNSLLVIIGTFVLAIGTELFILPAELDTGGVSGIAICFQYANINISSELIILIITWVLFFVGLIFLGLNFSLKTLLSTIFYPVFLFLLQFIVKYVPWLLISSSTSLANNPALMVLLSSIFGGFFVGAGCAITFLGGGSTGGVDIVTFVLCKYFKKIKSSVSIFVIDALIVIAGFLINPEHDLALCLEGVLCAFICALVIDKLFIGSNKTFVAYIVTDKYQEITNDIIKKIDRTTSLIEVQGGYSKEKKMMVMVSFNIAEYNIIMQIVSSNDKKAFMTINRAYEINGEGFKPLEKKDDIYE